MSLEISFARDLPKPITRLPPPCMRDIRNQKITPMMRNGTNMLRIAPSMLGCAIRESKPSARSAVAIASATASPCGSV